MKKKEEIWINKFWIPVAPQRDPPPLSSRPGTNISKNQAISQKFLHLTNIAPELPKRVPLPG